MLQISSGRGPVEVRAFVAQLAGRLEALGRARGLALLQRDALGGTPPGSVSLTFDGEPALVDDELGTHALVHPSERRGKHGRKRWFAGVTRHELIAKGRALDPADLEIRVARAGGPGGQRVNKVSSAVRIVHRPTGLQVRATDERSQRANRKKAIDRVAAALASRDANARAEAHAQKRAAHDRVERGAPVRVYRMAKDELVLVSLE